MRRSEINLCTMTMAIPKPEEVTASHGEMANAIRALAMDAVEAAGSA